MNKVPRWVFRYVGNKTFDFSSKKKRIFCPKTTKFGPKLAFLVNLGQAMQAYSMPCCGSVGGCGARAVSRKTPIYFIFKLLEPLIVKSSLGRPFLVITQMWWDAHPSVSSPLSRGASNSQNPLQAQ